MVVTTTTQPTHVFQDGETLWSIAESLLGDGQRWREIADLNGIDDPSAIPHGLVLVLPQQATESASTTATSTTTAWTSTTLSESDQMLESRYEWGSGGDRVAALQDLLGVQADGWYGANTREAHIAALTSRGLSTVLVPSPAVVSGGVDDREWFDCDTSSASEGWRLLEVECSGDSEDFAVDPVDPAAPHGIECDSHYWIDEWVVECWRDRSTSTGAVVQGGRVTFDEIGDSWFGSDGSVCEFDGVGSSCFGGDKHGVWYEEDSYGSWWGSDGSVCDFDGLGMTCR